MSVGILAAAPIAGRYISKQGKYRILPIIGYRFLSVGTILLTTLTAATNLVLVSLFLMLVGLGLGFICPVVTTAVQNAVPREVTGTATAAGLMVRQVGGSLAVALYGAIFAGRMATALASIDGMTPEAASQIGPQMMAGLTEAARGQVITGPVDALHPVYWLAFGLAVFGLGFSFLLKEIPLVNRMVPKGA